MPDLVPYCCDSALGTVSPPKTPALAREGCGPEEIADKVTSPGAEGFCIAIWDISLPTKGVSNVGSPNIIQTSVAHRFATSSTAFHSGSGHPRSQSYCSSDGLPDVTRREASRRRSHKTWVVLFETGLRRQPPIRGSDDPVLPWPAGLTR